MVPVARLCEVGARELVRQRRYALAFRVLVSFSAGHGLGSGFWRKVQEGQVVYVLHVGIAKPCGSGPVLGGSQARGRSQTLDVPCTVLTKPLVRGSRTRWNSLLPCCLANAWDCHELPVSLLCLPNCTETCMRHHVRRESPPAMACTHVSSIACKVLTTFHSLILTSRIFRTVRRVPSGYSTTQTPCLYFFIRPNASLGHQHPPPGFQNTVPAVTHSIRRESFVQLRETRIIPSVQNAQPNSGICQTICFFTKYRHLPSIPFRAARDCTR